MRGGKNTKQRRPSLLRGGSPERWEDENASHTHEQMVSIQERRGKKEKVMTCFVSPSCISVRCKSLRTAKDHNLISHKTKLSTISDSKKETCRFPKALNRTLHWEPFLGQYFTLSKCLIQSDKIIRRTSSKKKATGTASVGLERGREGTVQVETSVGSHLRVSEEWRKKVSPVWWRDCLRQKNEGGHGEVRGRREMGNDVSGKDAITWINGKQLDRTRTL